jgi:hypothetical protein
MKPPGTHDTLQPLMDIHTSSKIFPLIGIEGDLLAEENLHTVSQLQEVDDLTGHLTIDENRALMEALTPFPLLQYTVLRVIRMQIRKVYGWKRARPQVSFVT